MSVHSLAMMTFFRSVLLHPLDDVRVSPGVDPRAVEGLLVGNIGCSAGRSAPPRSARTVVSRVGTPKSFVGLRQSATLMLVWGSWLPQGRRTGKAHVPGRDRAVLRRVSGPAGISDSGSPGGRQTPGSSPRSGSRRSWPVRRPARQARLAEPGHPTPVGLGSAYASGPSESLTSLRALRVRSREPDRARPRSAEHAGSSFVADPGSLDRASLRWPSGSSSSGRIGSGEDVQGPVGRERRSGRFSVRVWCPSCRVSARSDGTRRPQA